MVKRFWSHAASDRNNTKTTTETLPVRSSVITPTTRGLQTLQHNLHCLCKLSRPHIVNQVKIWISKQRWQMMDGETLSAGLYLHHWMLLIKPVRVSAAINSIMFINDSSEDYFQDWRRHFLKQTVCLTPKTLHLPSRWDKAADSHI